MRSKRAGSTFKIQFEAADRPTRCWQQFTVSRSHCRPVAEANSACHRSSSIHIVIPWVDQVKSSHSMKRNVWKESPETRQCWRASRWAVTPRNTAKISFSISNIYSGLAADRRGVQRVHCAPQSCSTKSQSPKEGRSTVFRYTRCPCEKVKPSFHSCDHGQNVNPARGRE